MWECCSRGGRIVIVEGRDLVGGSRDRAGEEKRKKTPTKPNTMVQTPA